MRHDNPSPHATEAPTEAEPPPAPSESKIDKPARFGYPLEVLEDGCESFGHVLRQANFRALVRYIEDGKMNLGHVAGIPDAWKVRFRSADFRSSSYTWRNPKIHLLTLSSAAAMALDELLRRLADGENLDH